ELPGPPLPDRDASIQATRSEIPAVGAVRHAHDRYRMRQLPRLFVAPPLEVVPFPATQVLRACVEPLLSAPQVACLQLPCRRRDALVVRSALLSFEGLFEPPFGLDLGLQGTRGYDGARRQASYGQQYRQGHSRRGHQHPLLPPGELAEPVECR